MTIEQKCELCGEVKGLLSFPIRGNSVENTHFDKYCNECIGYALTGSMSLQQVNELISKTRVSWQEMNYVD